MQNPSTGRVSSEYGWRTHPITGKRSLHTGRDFSWSDGDPQTDLEHDLTIVAPADGIVVAVAWAGGYGLRLVIDHGNGVHSWLCHLALGGAIGIGSRVRGGQPVARMGSTGNSTGTHLHFEVRTGATSPGSGKHTDPAAWLTSTAALPGDDDDMFDAAAEAGINARIDAIYTKTQSALLREARARVYQNIETRELVAASPLNGFYYPITQGQGQIDSLKVNYQLVGLDEYPKQIAQTQWDNLRGLCEYQRRQLADSVLDAVEDRAAALEAKQ